MDRTHVIQGFLDLFPSPSYLEIGVNAGLTFHNVTAVKKTAVDPAFTFEPKNSPDVEYIQTASDEYFAKHVVRDQKFDVIFIDGLHTFEQTLRDLMNTLSVVKGGSIIIIDDVLPLDYASSLSPAEELHRFRHLTGDTNVAWMGDVYKLVFFIAAYLPQYSYATVAENHGQTVLWLQPREPDERFAMEEIACASFSDTVLQRDVFRIAPFAEIHALVRAART